MCVCIPVLSVGVVRCWELCTGVGKLLVSSHLLHMWQDLWFLLSWFLLLWFLLYGFCCHGFCVISCHVHYTQSVFTAASCCSCRSVRRQWAESVRRRWRGGAEITQHNLVTVQVYSTWSNMLCKTSSPHEHTMCVLLQDLQLTCRGYMYGNVCGLHHTGW